MSYRIAYGTSNKRKYFLKPKRYAVKWAVGIFVALAVWVVLGDNIQELLLPGDPKVTDAALSTLVDSLHSGEPIHNALQAFCVDVLQGAGVYG